MVKPNRVMTMQETRTRITAQVCTQAVLVNATQASFGETQHRESDGVSISIADDWRARANKRKKVVISK